MLAHIRDGKLIKLYQTDSGWVTLENGDTVTPPTAGYSNGNDKIVVVDEKIVYANTISAVEITEEYNVLKTKVNKIVTYSDKKISIDEVKIEAEDRILKIFPEHKQRNSIAWTLEMVVLHGSDKKKWPKDIKKQQEQIDELWIQIKTIRNKSNEIEQMNPIPSNYKDDLYWI